MKILHLNCLYPPDVRGGAERFVAALARAQAARGHDVGVVTLSREQERSRVDDGVTVYRIGYGNLFWFEDWQQYPAPVRYLNKLMTNWNPILLARVRRAVADFHPDVMNTHCMLSFATDSWKAASERSIPIVHALHEFNLVCRNTNAFRNGKMCEKPCLACKYNAPKRWMSKDVSGVVGVSQDTLQRHLDYGFFHHIPERLRRVIWSMPPIEIRDRPSRPKERPFTIGFIGRIVPEKGIEDLLDAATKITASKPWKIVVAGKVAPPLDETTLHRRVANYPVEWLGVVQSREFYPQIDLLVVPPTWADPGPLVVHEAFANSVPVIGTRMGGVMDMVKPGVTGWLFNPGDSDDLAALLTERIDAGSAALPSPENFLAFQKLTTDDNVAAQYEQLYQNLLDEKSAN